MNAARRVEEPKAVEIRVQGNWKRLNGVATRYELALAIDRLLEAGKIDIDVEGRLRLARRRGRVVEDVPREVRWARADEELRAFCQRMDVKGSKPSKAVDDEQDYGVRTGGLVTSVHGSSPRRGVAKYVMRELRDKGSLAYENLIDIISELGGLEWVMEDHDVARQRARAGASRRSRRGT